LYAHTQATPWGATLDASLRNTDGSFRAPLAADAGRTASAFTFQNGLVAGTVMAKGAGESMLVATGSNPSGTGLGPYAFGLLANFVGGNLDELGDENQIGVWRGPDSAFELIFPAFDDTGLAAAYSAATTAGIPVSLYAGQDGRLTALGSPGNRQVVAHLVERASASKIVIDLKV